MSAIIVGNPNQPMPSGALEYIITVPVRFFTFEGEYELGNIEIHRDLAEDVKAFFNLVCELRFPIKKVAPASGYDWDDQVLMREGVAHGFNNRMIQGEERFSLHTYGAAFDVNQHLNPMRLTLNGVESIQPEGCAWTPGVLGTFTKDHPLVTLLVERGWVWGGTWQEPFDPHHFQKELVISYT